MKNLSALLLCLLIFSSAPISQAATKGQITVESLGESEFFYDANSGLATATNGLIVKYGGASLTANQVRINQETGDVLAEGNVILQKDGQLWRGERLIYNFRREQISGGNFRLGERPVFASGQGLVTLQSNKVYVATNTFLTADDYSRPAYRIRLKKVTIVPGKYIQGKHALLYLGDVPVFYFPFLRKALDREANNFDFTPGYRSLYGPYLLSSYNWFWDKQLHGAINLDYRQKRGVGVGPDFYWTSPIFGDGLFRYYYLHDEDPRKDRFRQTIPADRQRVYFANQWAPRSNLTVKAVVRYQSDRQIIRDFFESEYRENVQPSSFLEVNQNWRNWSLNLLTQPQINGFQETVERLPDVKLQGLRQQIGVSPFYYESDSSAGYYRHSFSDMRTNRFFPVRDRDFAAARADTYHQILLPWTFFGWLNVAPRVGGRFTYYGEANGRGAITSEETRGVFNTGAEITFKASRVWTQAENRLLDVKGLRHIIEPSINYVYVPRPHPLPRDLPQFDPELPSYRLLPIEFPDYNAIDAIDSQNVLRLGMRNKLQTKRSDGVENLVNWALYTDWRLDPRDDQSTFSDVYSDLDFKPRSWLTLTSETRYNVEAGRFDEANHTLILRPGNRWSVSLGHRFREDSRIFGMGNNLIISTLYYRFNENWGARVSHHYEARDGRLEQQYYTLYRDMRSWTAALTFRIHESRFAEDDFTVAFTFSFKAFPRFGVGSDSSRPSLLLGS